MFFITFVCRIARSTSLAACIQPGTYLLKIISFVLNSIYLMTLHTNVKLSNSCLTNALFYCSKLKFTREFIVNLKFGISSVILTRLISLIISLSVSTRFIVIFLIFYLKTLLNVMLIVLTFSTLLSSSASFNCSFLSSLFLGLSMISTN